MKNREVKNGNLNEDLRGWVFCYYCLFVDPTKENIKMWWNLEADFWWKKFFAFFDYTERSWIMFEFLNALRTCKKEGETAKVGERGK